MHGHSLHCPKNHETPERTHFARSAPSIATSSPLFLVHVTEFAPALARSPPSRPPGPVGRLPLATHQLRHLLRSIPPPQVQGRSHAPPCLSTCPASCARAVLATRTDGGPAAFAPNRLRAVIKVGSSDACLQQGSSWLLYDAVNSGRCRCRAVQAIPGVGARMCACNSVPPSSPPPPRAGSPARGRCTA